MMTHNGDFMRTCIMETERLLFSVWEKDDLELAQSLWGDPEVSRFICAAGSFTEQEVEERLALEIHNYEQSGIQYFPIFRRDTHTLAGCCGLRPCGDEEGILELGVHLKREYHGQGLAKEAAEKIITYAFDTRSVKELRSGHHPQNSASQRLLYRLGFSYTGDCYYAPTGLYHPTYHLRPETFVLGFDIGGTKCAVLLGQVTEETVDFLGREQIKTGTDWKAVLDLLIRKGRVLLEKNELKNSRWLKIGISCGGPLSPDRKRILSPPNLPGWDDVPVVEYLSSAFSCPAKMENDADACALAEWKYGAGRGSRNMIFLTFGTGLGAGFILDGKLYKGSTGMAGEAGHIRLAENGPEGYGKEGSFEGFCSGSGIRNLAEIYAKKRLAQGVKVSYVDWPTEETSLEENGPQTEQALKALTAQSVAEAAVGGDEDALEIFRISGRYFGRGLSVLIDLLNPEIIVAGSIFTRSGKLLEETMYQEIKKEALPASASACTICPACLGEKIGDYGSIMAALN